jgi:hypothetical protein
VKSFAIAAGLYLCETVAAQATPHPHDCNGNGPWCVHLGGNPAPSIGSGITTALIIGGVVLSVRLLTSWRQS